MVNVFNQDTMNSLLDDNLVLSMNIVCKVISGELIPGQDCLGDWLESLTDEELKILTDYFSQARGEEIDNEESVYLIAEDLTTCICFLYALEKDTEDGFNGERMPEMLEFLDIVSTVESIRRDGLAEIVEKARISDPDIFLVRGKKKRRGRKKKVDK